MNRLPAEKRAAILSALVEGMSISAVVRMTGCGNKTVLRLLADFGTFCAEYHDKHVRNVAASRIECDELWSYCGCKEKAKRRGAGGYGDAWVWVGMDSDSKLVLGYVVGDRNSAHAEWIMRDIAKRVVGRPQVTTDGFGAYPWAVYSAFDGNVDHAILQKKYGQVLGESGRYSPPMCVGCTREVQYGTPNLETASTSFIERQNLTVRMQSRRFTRLTNGFSKRIQNHEHALAIHYFHYNFIRKHMTLKTTPAVAAGIASRALTMLDLVAMVEREEEARGGRLTEYLPAVA